MIKGLIFTFTFYCYVFCFAQEIVACDSFIESSIAKQIANVIDKKGVAVKCDFNEKEILEQIKQNNNYIKRVGLDKVDQGQKRFEANVYTTHGHKIHLSGSYKCYLLIPTFKQFVKANHAISIDKDIENRYFLDEHINQNIILTVDALQGNRVNKNISAFTPIKKEYIKNKILISQKDIVKVIYKNKSLYITSFGIALESGSIGDVIRVRDSKNKSFIYSGKVIAEKTVEIL